MKVGQLHTLNCNRSKLQGFFDTIRHGAGMITL